MNSGKSTNLMQVAHNYEERGMKVVLIKPSIDKKGGDKLVSRLGVERKVDLIIDENKNIYDEIRLWENSKYKIDCILVDDKFNNELRKIDPIVYRKSNHTETYAWKLEDIKKYDEVIYIKGKLGLWNYEGKVNEYDTQNEIT